MCPIRIIDTIKPNGLPLGQTQFPTVEDIDTLGGFQVQPSTSARDAIPAGNRKAGMFVYVTSNGTFYQLASNLTTWNVLSLGGSVTLGGDVTGPGGGNLVSNLQGNPLSITSPVAGQVIGWNGSSFVMTNVLSTNVAQTTISYAAPIFDQIILVGTLSGPINVTLPASPTADQQLIIKDAKGSASSFNITILRNGNLIDNSATNLVMNANFQSVQLVFTSFGWNIL